MIDASRRTQISHKSPSSYFDSFKTKFFFDVRSPLRNMICGTNLPFKNLNNPPINIVHQGVPIININTYYPRRRAEMDNKN